MLDTAYPSSRLASALRSVFKERPSLARFVFSDAEIDQHDLAIAFLYQRVATMEFLMERRRERQAEAGRA